MKKVLLLLMLILFVGAAIGAWIFLGSATAFNEKEKTLYISSKAATKQAVLDSISKNNILKNEGMFGWLAEQMGYWAVIKPGKYDIEKGSNLISVIKKLRNGKQTPVNLVITKLRTKYDLAKLTGRKFEFDSADMIDYLSNADSLNNFNVDSNTVMTLVLPDTYTYFWNSTPQTVLKKLADESEKFWNEERIKKASDQGLTPKTAYILSSIVSEETNAMDEKDTIASVYINRIKSGMPLQADPTVKFALQDFSLRRILLKHLSVESPYNTYRNSGLPPGPISTPSKNTIDAVLSAPQTEYYYFVASSNFDGTHDFSKNYNEHLLKAKVYQQALNEYLKKKNGQP